MNFFIHVSSKFFFYNSVVKFWDIFICEGSISKNFIIWDFKRVFSYFICYFFFKLCWKIGNIFNNFVFIILSTDTDQNQEWHQKKHKSKITWMIPSLQSSFFLLYHFCLVLICDFVFSSFFFFSIMILSWLDLQYESL